METTLKLIENHGFVLVALVVIVFWIAPKLDEMWKLIVDMARKQPEPSAPQKPLPERIRDSDITDDKIMSLLRAILTDMRCSRAYVFCYHNGGENILGHSFSKISCTHEVVALGVKPQQGWLQQMPKTLVHAFTRLIDSGLGVFCPCIEECFMETDSSTYETLRQQGIDSVYCVGLYSDARLPIGFLGIDYCDGKTTISEDQFDRLKIFAERAASTFCLNGHKMCHLEDQR